MSGVALDVENGVVTLLCAGVVAPPAVALTRGVTLDVDRCPSTSLSAEKLDLDVLDPGFLAGVLVEMLASVGVSHTVDEDEDAVKGFLKFLL